MQLFNLKNYFGKKPTTPSTKEQQPPPSLQLQQPEKQQQPQANSQTEVQQSKTQQSSQQENKIQTEQHQEGQSSLAVSTPSLISHSPSLVSHNDSVNMSELVENDSSFNGITFFPQSPSRPIALNDQQLTEVRISSSPLLSSQLNNEQISSTFTDNLLSE